MTVEKIRYTDYLKQGTDKLNQVVDLGNQIVVDAANANSKADTAISTANGAVVTADGAVTTANTAKTTADATATQLETVIIESGTSDAETLAARIDGNTGESYPTVGGRLDSVTSQLTKTVEKIPNVANATDIIKVLNPYGNYQNIHPKVLFFENGWNGYKWWMAYTPYPNGDTKKENPCLAVSNDGVIWTVPTGFVNVPLEEWNGVSTSYNNDTHLVFRQDLNQLEIWYRTADSGSKVVNLKRRITTDGINWGSIEVLFTGTQDLDDHISPAVIYEDNKYKMLSVQNSNGWKMFYSESMDGFSWGARVSTTMDLSGGLAIWHLDFIKSDIGYEIVLQAFKSIEGETNNTASLYYSNSMDLMNFIKPVKILAPTPLKNKFDDSGIYRSSILKINDIYYVYYSAIKNNGERALSLSYGKNIEGLKGYQKSSGDTFTDVTLTNGNTKAILKANPNLINAVDLLQGTDETRYGHLKIGNLFFADGDVSSTTPDKSTIKYVPSRDEHRKYNGSTWVGLQTKVYTRLNTATPLASGVFVDIPFATDAFNNGKFANGVYTPLTTEYVKVTLGLNISNVAVGDTLEIQIKNATTNADLALVYKMPLNPVGAIQFINCVVPFQTNAPFKVSVKYTGPSVTATTTQYIAQNFLLIESI
ncbi:MAG: alanine-zipper protein [Planococcaceae bacterium]|nr:alanine-zipper protein [Planococcaceae bacterium]